MRRKLARSQHASRSIRRGQPERRPRASLARLLLPREWPPRRWMAARIAETVRRGAKTQPVKSVRKDWNEGARIVQGAVSPASFA